MNSNRIPNITRLRRLCIDYRYPILIILLASLFYLVINHYYKLYIYSDGPFHLSAIREMARNYSPRSPIIHIEGKPDRHYNVSVLLQSILYRLTGDIHKTVLISGSLFVFLFLGSLATLASRYTKKQMELSLVLMSSLFLWGPLHIVWAGVFSFTGLMINGFSSQTPGYAFLLIALFISGLKEQSTRLYFANAVLMAMCLVQHMLTGAILIFLYYLMKTDECATTGHYRPRDFLILLIVIPLYLLWPFYSTLDTLKEVYHHTRTFLPLIILLFPSYYVIRKKIHIPATWWDCVSKHKILECLLFLLIFFFIINCYFVAYPHFIIFPGHFKEFNPALSFILLCIFPLVGTTIRVDRNNSFLFSWLILLFIISLLGSIIHLVLYWRVLFFFLIPLHILAGIKVSKTDILFHKIIVILCAIILISSNLIFISTVCKWDKYRDLIHIVGLTPEGAVILSDHHTSYLISGLGNREVVTSFASHWGSFLSSDEKEERKDDVYIFFLDNTSTESRLKLLAKYNISHIIVADDEYDFEGFKYKYSDAVNEAIGKIDHNILVKKGSYTLFSVVGDDNTPLK